MRTIRRLSPVLLAVVVLGNVVGCAPGEFGAGAKMANTILNGAACGMAAANDTPCTPKAVLDSLAKDAAAQKAKIEAAAPAAAAVDAAQTKLLLDQMAANTESNLELTKALVALIEKGSASTASPPAAPSASATSAAPPAAPTPGATPSPAPVPPPAVTP